MGFLDKLKGALGGGKAQQGAASAPDPNRTPEEQAADFIAAKIPKEYPKSPVYRCDVRIDDGRLLATLALDITGKNLSDEDAYEITKLESQYLLEDVFRDAPVRIDFTLVYYKNSVEFAKVVRPAGFGIATRQCGEKSDWFTVEKV